MRKVIAIEWLTLDGVAQAPGVDDMSRKWMVDNLTEAGGYLLRPAPKHKAEVRGIDGSDWAAR